MSFFAHIVIDGYEPSAFVHVAMMAIIGAVFGRDILKNGDDK